MKGIISRRDSFLAHIQHQLGRYQSEALERPKWKHQINWYTNQHASKEEMVDQLKAQCKHIHTRVIDTTVEKAPYVLLSIMEEYGKGAVITSKDRRFDQYGLTSVFKGLKEEGIEVSRWGADLSRNENIAHAEKARYGVVFSDYTLAESGTVVLQSHEGQGRALHFLPLIYIVCIEKSTIVPRMIQAVSAFHHSVEKGEKTKGAIHFISGPSNSADIEMNLVVGVHGPVRAIYLLIDDE
ncbi:lactate utilization protein C [Bacillus sp. Bos-x628]|uniref:LutC/YkgG family protein n=1 Tax=Bacillus maqinnsis TaxID=3229854 RepID=UPI00338E11EC